MKPDEDAKKGPCDEIKEDLILCLKETECIQQGNTVKECFDKNRVPIECVNLRELMSACKRSLIDRRRRFRGRIDY